MADVQILAAGGTTAPLDYTLNQLAEIFPKAVRAHYDGSGAASAFLPCLVIFSATGAEVARIPASTAVAAGGSAEMSWFPRVKPPASAAVAPVNPLGTLFAWYDFSDASTLTLDGSGNISNVVDKTGNGHDCSQSTPSKRPGQALVNGLQAAVFNRANQQFLVSATFTGVVPNPITALAVFTIDNAPAGGEFPGIYGANDIAHNLLLFYGDGAHILSTQQHTPPAITAALATPCTQQQVTSIFDNTHSHLRLNQVDTAGTTTDLGCDNIMIGAQVDPNQPGEDDKLTGKVCELLFYQGHLTNPQLSGAENYLKTKWGTP